MANKHIKTYMTAFSSAQFSSVAQSCPTLCDPMDYCTPGSPVHHQLPELALTHVYRVSDAIQPSHPLSSPPSPAFNLSQHQGFFPNESALPIRWSKYWSFSFSVSPSNEYSGLISFNTDWFDHLAVQGTLKSLFQHYSSKASILWHSAFFMVQLSHPYILAIVNSTSVNIGVHMSFSIMVSSGYMPSSGITGSYSSFIPSDFKESPYCSP